MNNIIVPCHNEEKNVLKVIKKVKKFTNYNFEIIVVDNNSKDRTFEKARKSGVIVIKERRKGKGMAMFAGAKKAKGEILIFIDGDDSYSPKAIQKMVNLLRGKEDCIVYGSRFLKESKTNISFFRLIGNKFFSFLGRIIYKKNTDFLTGFFAIKKESFLSLDLKSTGFEIETEIFTKSVKKNFRIEEVPIEYKAKKESKINPIVDGMKILITLLINKLC